MTEHVSVETARKLAAAGWQHDWSVGDWYTWDDEQHGRDLRLLGAESAARWFRHRQQDGFTVPLHLPTAGQILQALAARGLPLQMICQEDPVSVSAWRYSRGGRITRGQGADLTEALAVCWLAAKGAEET